MMAIARSDRSLALAIAGAGLLLLSSCNAPPPPAPIRPPEPAPALPPPPAPPPPADWRDTMPPPGTWRWGVSEGRSGAQYVAASGAALASLTCDKAGARVLLGRAGIASASVAMIVTTTGGGNRPLLSDPPLGGANWIVAAISARDPLLDAMAFSRGRFLLDVAGQAPLALPSWPEVSRVIEDCR